MRQLWTKIYPEALADGRVSFVSLDFFNGRPVEGADVYVVRDPQTESSDVSSLISPSTSAQSHLASLQRTTPQTSANG